MIKKKVSVDMLSFILSFILLYSTLSNAVTLYLSETRTESTAFVAIDTKEFPFANAPNTLTKPWISALPLFGCYQVTRLNAEKDATEILLSAKDGKGVKLQQLLGDGGLLLQTDNETTGSGLWRNQVDGRYKSFGVLSLPQPTMHALTQSLQIGNTIRIKSLAQRNIDHNPLVTIEGQKFLRHSKYNLPYQNYESPQNNNDLYFQVLNSASGQMITFRVPASRFPSGANVPDVAQVKLQLWRLGVENAENSKLLHDRESNVNSPYIAQFTLDSHALNPGDKLLIVTTEYLALPTESQDACQNENLQIQAAQSALNGTFNLTELRQHIKMPNTNNLDGWMYQLRQQYLVPVEHDGKLYWRWRTNSEKQAQVNKQLFVWERFFHFTLN